MRRSRSNMLSQRYLLLLLRVLSHLARRILGQTDLALINQNEQFARHLRQGVATLGELERSTPTVVSQENASRLCMYVL